MAWIFVRVEQSTKGQREANRLCAQAPSSILCTLPWKSHPQPGHLLGRGRRQTELHACIPVRLWWSASHRLGRYNKTPRRRN